jgi:aminoglycoside 6'-N-acetyltransferase
MELTEGDLSLRQFAAMDEAAVVAILCEPEVARWWPVPDFERDTGWVIEAGGRPSGWLEYHEEDYAWYPSVAFDIALTSALHGRGYGRRALRLAIDSFVAKGHHRFTLDPNVDNERAIRAYEALGFERAGVMRAYERNPAGGWNDALLLELIVPEAIARDALVPKAGKERWPTSRSPGTERRASSRSR